MLCFTMFAKEWDFHVFIFVTLSMKKILIMIINFMNVLSSNLWGVFTFKCTLNIKFGIALWYIFILGRISFLLTLVIIAYESEHILYFRSRPRTPP